MKDILPSAGWEHGARSKEQELKISLMGRILFLCESIRAVLEVIFPVDRPACHSLANNLYKQY